VLRHIDVWRAKRNLSVSLLRVFRRAAQCQFDVVRRETGMERRDAVVSMMPVQQRSSSHKTVNPVRQCVRRVSELDVAQASPLFSDHAPREVHLWQ
jgi:hypothetical protein